MKIMKSCQGIELKLQSHSIVQYRYKNNKKTGKHANVNICSVHKFDRSFLKHNARETITQVYVNLN